MNAKWRRALSSAALTRGVPEHIRSDNGPGSLRLLSATGSLPLAAKTAYIEPGSPLGGHGYCESFNGKLRDELLNGEIFYTMKEAQIVIENWRRRSAQRNF
jgi:hypothetical protein